MSGETRDRYGWRVYVKVGSGPTRLQREKRFPADATAEVRKAWREETRVELRKLRPTKQGLGTIRADVDRYLLQVQAMPTYAQRKAHLEAWIENLGAHRLRLTIKAGDIRAVLQTWRLTFDAATCNKRRTALMHLWSVLDGKGASNPVRDVHKFPVPPPLPRGRDPHTIDRQLLTARRCRSRACCRVLLWTGLRPAELAAAQPDDLSLTHRLFIARTVKRGRTRTIPLTTQAVSAWKEFQREDAWHRVPKAAPLNRWLKKITGIATLRVYDLRHSYGTALARQETRLDVIGALMGHSTLELTKRYTLAAVTPDALVATQRLGHTPRPTSRPASRSAVRSGKACHVLTQVVRSGRGRSL